MMSNDSEFIRASLCICCLSFIRICYNGTLIKHYNRNENLFLEKMVKRNVCFLVVLIIRRFFFTLLIFGVRRGMYPRGKLTN